MAITLADFTRIWASTSPLTPYSFSDANYQEGWNFIGSTPPARQMWDSIQKTNDEKLKYIVDNFLPTAGGTMTGSIEYANETKTFDIGFSDANKDNIDIGWNYADGDGAGIGLRSADHTDAGAFNLYAKNGNTETALVGKPSGELEWNEKSIPQRAYGITLTSSGQNTYTFTISENSAVIFAKRGNNCGVYMVTYWDTNPTKIFTTGTEPITITKSSNSNSVTITNVNSSAVAIKILNGGTL